MKNTSEKSSQNSNETKGLNPNRVVVKKDTASGEWSAIVYVDGKRCEARTYYTDDKQDAADTAVMMRNDARTFAPVVVKKARKKAAKASKPAAPVVAAPSVVECSDCDGRGAFSRDGDDTRSVYPSDPNSCACSRCHGTGKLAAPVAATGKVTVAIELPRLVTRSIAAAVEALDKWNPWTRDLAAALIRSHGVNEANGYTVYLGGRHVAVLVGEVRILLVTATVFEDWN